MKQTPDSNFPQPTNGASTTPSKADVEAETICQLIELLQSVNVNSPEAKLNATSISDGKGGRIEL